MIYQVPSMFDPSFKPGKSPWPSHSCQFLTIATKKPTGAQPKTARKEKKHPKSGNKKWTLRENHRYPLIEMIHLLGHLEGRMRFLSANAAAPFTSSSSKASSEFFLLLKYHNHPTIAAAICSPRCQKLRLHLGHKLLPFLIHLLHRGAAVRQEVKGIQGTLLRLAPGDRGLWSPYHTISANMLQPHPACHRQRSQTHDVPPSLAVRLRHWKEKRPSG